VNEGCMVCAEVLDQEVSSKRISWSGMMSARRYCWAGPWLKRRSPEFTFPTGESAKLLRLGAKIRNCQRR
jgi:hypothetical protein